MDKAVGLSLVFHTILLGTLVRGQPISKLVACANEDCSAPLSVAEAAETYVPVKKTGEHLEFYKGEKIRVFERYLSPPFNKFWRGEVIGVKPVVRAMFPKSMVKELEVFHNQPVTVDRAALEQQEAGQPGDSTKDQPETTPGVDGEISPTPGKENIQQQPPADSAANAVHVEDPLLAQMEKLQKKMAATSNTNEPTGEPASHNPDVVESLETEKQTDIGLGSEDEQQMEGDDEESEDTSEQQDTVAEGSQSQDGKINEEQLAEEKRMENERLAEEKLEEERRAEEKKREEERAAEEKKIEEERLAEEEKKKEQERLEQERLVEEKKKEEEKLAEEEKKKEEERLEQERLVEEKKKEEEKLAEEEKKKEQERLEQERLVEEKKKEEERLADEEKKKEEERLEQERLVEEKKKEEERLAEEEKKKEQERLAEEEKKKEQERLEQERLVEEKKKEEERLAEEEKKKEEERLEQERLVEEKKKEEERLAEEEKKKERLEQGRLLEEKKKEAERLAEEEKNKEQERLAVEKRIEEERIAEEKKDERLAEEEKEREERLAEEKFENERIAQEKQKEEKRLAEERKIEEERLAEEKRKMEEQQAREEEERLIEEQRQLDLKKNQESADVVNTEPPLKPTIDAQVEPTAVVPDAEPATPEPSDSILPSPPQDEAVSVNQSTDKPADSQGVEAADAGVNNSDDVPSSTEQSSVGEDVIDPIDKLVNEVQQPQVTPEVDEELPVDSQVTTVPTQDASSESGPGLESQQPHQPTPEDFQQNTEANQQNTDANQQNTEANQQNTESNQQNTEANQQNTEANQQNTDANQQNTEANQQNTEANQQNTEANQQNTEVNQQNTEANTESSSSTHKEWHEEAPEARQPNDGEEVKQGQEWMHADEDAGYESDDGFSFEEELHSTTEAQTSEEGEGESTPNLNEAEATTISSTEAIYEDDYPLPPQGSDDVGVTESPTDDLTTSQPDNSDKAESRVYQQSAYAREFDLESRPIRYKYTNILNKLEGGLEQQGWIAASLMPEFFQPMLAREPFGLVGFQLMLVLAVGLSVCIALFLYLLMFAVMSCISGCTDASKARGFAREALEKYAAILAESNDTESKMKDLANEASIAQGELTEIRDKLKETEEDKGRLAARIDEMSRENLTAMQTLQVEMEQTAGYLKEWEVYGKTQQTLFETEAAKSQQLASELEQVKAEAEQASQQLQDRSELSGSKVKEMEDSISQLKSQLELLKGELEQKVADSEALLLERNDLDTRCSQMTGELSEKRAELDSLSAEKEEMQRTLSLRNDELEILRGCVSEITQLDSSDDDEQRKEAISALLDTAKLKTEMEELQRSYSELQDRLQSEIISKSNTEETLKNMKLKLDVVGNNLEASQKETSDARAALTHMTDMYERTKLANVRLAAEAASAESATGEDELRQQVNDLKAETLQLRETAQQQQEEFKTSERDLRKRVIDSERKAHETWLQHREAERKVASLKQELDTLRRSYANLEADYQDGEASFRELQAQMERRERDDASITSERRPPSRSSVRSSRFEDRRSESPFNGSEKPVDPLRAPPPVSTYSKKKKKAKDTQRYAQPPSQHTPSPHLTPSPNTVSQQAMSDLQSIPPQFNPPFHPHEGQFPAQDPQMCSQDPQQLLHPMNNQYGQVPQYPPQDMQQYPPQQFPQQSFPPQDPMAPGQYPPS